ncbi:MAG: alkaline phosphatase D family protein [Chitinophagales bacterium]
MKKILLSALGLLALCLANAQEHHPQVLNTIAFGSCNDQNKPQEIWYKIAAEKPDLFIFLGDNIYADTKDMKVMQAKYDQLASKPGYIELQKHAPVIATWDDHDYGVNDGGRCYKMKEQSKEIFLKFFHEPDSSERRKHKGVYTSYTYGPDGKKLQVIMLDLRSFRTGLLRKKLDRDCKGPYFKMPAHWRTFLGKEQWAWLEEQLKQPADLRLIGSSTQFLVDFNGWEAWVNMPHERERFMRLIEKTKANGVFFISGDLHYAELSKLKRDSCYTLYDLTSSGLTHGHSCDGGNKNRIGQPFMKPNYGVIHLDWDKKKITLEVKDEQGTSQIKHEVPMTELKF